jgi:glyoxylase-like metal-dependent hydrolase (beta-lactamase superfamily II)
MLAEIADERRKVMKKIYLSFIMALLAGMALAQAKAENSVRVERLSERVLLLTEVSPMENLVVAIATKKGIVVVDATSSPTTAALFRSAIQREFKRNDFAYLILTHPHWDHAFGCQGFPEAGVIIHENGAQPLAGSGAAAERIAAGARDRLSALNKELAALDSDPKRKADIETDIAFRERIVQGLSGGFAPTTATLSFSNKMVLDMGDVSFHLQFFGRAHSGCDIFIHVPEEKILITGDIFLDKGWLPLFAGMETLDIPRWIEVLNALFADPGGFATVIPGHRNTWSREKLAMWKEYIEGLWQGVNEAKREKLNFEQAAIRMPLGERYNYLKELGHTDEELQRFHRSNLSAFWRQLLIPVIPMLKETMGKKGMAAAVDRCRSLWKNEKEEYNFSETGLNQFGYQLLDREDKGPAIELFKFIVEIYPSSANAYDSLGEAYMADGNTTLAIKNFEKSLQLNPANANAVEMLKRLREKK